MRSELTRRFSTASCLALLSGLLFAASAGATAPELTTGEATAVTQGSAVLNGIVAAGGQEALYGFEYGTVEESNEGTEGEIIPKGAASPTEVSQKVTGLAPNTKYYYRIAAATDKVAFGEYETFTTPSPHVPSFEAGEYPASVTGGQDPEDTITLKAGASLGCDNIDLAASLPAANPALPVTADYSDCSMSIGDNTSITMNSCYFVFGVDNAGPPHVGDVAVNCADAEDRIEISNSKCSFALLPGSFSAAAEYANDGAEGSEYVLATFAASGVEVGEKSGSLCFLVGAKATIAGTVWLAANAGENEGVDFIVANDEAQQSGVFVTGEESEEEGLQPRFAAEQYPQALLFEQDLEDEVVVFKTSGAQATCETGNWSSELGSAASSVALTATFGNCSFLGAPATVTMGNCKYVLNVANAGPPYVGTPEISCEAGDAIGISRSGCTVVIGSQAADGNVAYENEGEASGRAVDVDVAASGVKYSKTGPLCFLVGNGSNGTFGFGLRMYGLK